MLANYKLMSQLLRKFKRLFFLHRISYFPCLFLSFFDKRLIVSTTLFADFWRIQICTLHTSSGFSRQKPNIKVNNKNTRKSDSLQSCQEKHLHCVKIVRIRSFSVLHLRAFRLNTEICEVNLRIQSECVKIWTRNTPNTDTFHAVLILLVFLRSTYLVIVLSGGKIIPTKFIFEWFNAAMS